MPSYEQIQQKLDHDDFFQSYVMETTASERTYPGLWSPATEERISKGGWYDADRDYASHRERRKRSHDRRKRWSSRRAPGAISKVETAFASMN